MKIWRSVVGKLWATIIGLVALVLLVNSLFMGQFIDNNLANYKDQEVNLQKLASQFAQMLPLHLKDSPYLQAANEILDAQEAVMILVDPEGRPVATGPDRQTVSPEDRWKLVDIKDVFRAGELQRTLQGETVSTTFVLRDSSAQRYIAVAVPLLSGERIVGAVALYQKQYSLDNTEAYFKRLFIYAIVVGFLLTTFFAFFLSSKITRPLLQMKQAADLITQGNYHSRVPVPSGDEIGELAKSFNHMTARLDESIAALNQEKGHLASVLRSMTDAVITFDAEGAVILSNPPGLAILEDWSQIQWENGEGTKASNKAGDAADAGEDGSPGAGHAVPEPLLQLFESVVSGRKELQSKLHVRSGVWSVGMAPLYADRQIRGAVAVLRDVTEEFRLEKLRKDFVANVSHELRTPLSMLQGYSEALLDDIATSPEERQELVQVIHDESLRMVRLVSDLLDLARMEAGRMEMNFRPVALRPLLGRVHRKFAVLSKERGIAMKMELAEDAPLELACADEDRLEQVLTNLLDNAVRHTPEGRAITMRAAETLRGAVRHVELEIEDRGQGIPPSDLPFIFERFYKADKARTRGANGGTGLGLAIVKNIVDAHRGTVLAESELGEGTRFTIRLPVDCG